MSEKIKQSSFRFIEDDIEKFKELADKQGINQAEMFNGLLNAFEMAKAKGTITDRAKEIEVFQDTVNTLVSMFINSLAINQSSEERIRETLSLELNTKDKTIADLQLYKDNTKESLKILEEKNKDLENKVKDLTNSLDKKENEINNKSVAIERTQEQISTLNEIVTEYKEYKDKNKELEFENEKLKNEISNKDHVISDLESKVVNIENMRDFYKDEILKTREQRDSLIEEIYKKEKEYKEEIKAIEKENKKDIKDIKDEHSREIIKLKNELKNKFEFDLKNNLDIEKSKFQVENDKLINENKLCQLQLENLNEKLNEKLNKK